MKTRTVYTCEVCGRESTQREAVERCEARPVPVAYPVGMIFGHHTGRNDLYHDMTFAVAEYSVDGHSPRMGLWACRDNGKGDSLGGQLCGGHFSVLGPYDSQVNPNTPRFQRMVTWLVSQKIPVTVWDGHRPLPLDRWLMSDASQNWTRETMSNSGPG